MSGRGAAGTHGQAPRPRPSVVFFDAGNTLFTERVSRDEVYAQALRRFGLEAEVGQVAAWRAAVYAEMPEHADGHVPFTDAWFRELMTRLLHRAGSDADPEAVRAHLAEHFSRPDSFELFEDTLEALEGLAAHGLRLGVISNWSERLAGLLDGLGLTPHFEAVVISAVVGHTKPDPLIFERALSLMGVPAAEAVHVGDHPIYDVEGARRAGLGALLVDRAGKTRRGPEVIQGLGQVIDRIDGR